ncbi:MAG: tRNA glutamyl-Q synthetase [Opitutaceae bacterium]|nr:tRNA glutamyl-Q synthetase [Opitutaceae bacterium]|tara:strand:+ start:214 stop:1035 length:822 start_codon:yes stop_codon:yes gene_type:complete
MTPVLYRGRIAPSPTGYLHLGHAKTFWKAFDRCREAQGTLIYRDEDIDLQRCKQEYSQAAMADLEQLGIHWQEGPYYQSERVDNYRSSMIKLIRSKSVYPCRYSRKTIEEHPDAKKTPTGEVIFPKSLRPRQSEMMDFFEESLNWRFRVPNQEKVQFKDLNQGHQSFECDQEFGDFLVWRKDGMPAYELAVVVDDAAMKISEVVRGADLLLSTARQILLYEALAETAPEFYHVNLVCDSEGHRLAKRNDSLALKTLFAEGHDFQSIAAMWNPS